MRLVIRLLTCAALLLWLSGSASAQVVMHTVSITTDGSGNATVYTPSTYGYVVAIRYVPGASTPLATGADITVTDNVTGLAILTVTNMGLLAREFAPRMEIVNSVGAFSAYAAGGVNVLDQFPVAGAIKVAVVQGGATATGTLLIYVAGR